MHQHPRPAPRGATPAGNAITNPERTNNPRDQPFIRNRSSVDLASYTERAGGEIATMASRNEGAAGSSQDRENQKLNQIIQHFHCKAALMICASRANLPQIQNKNGEIRQNRWFNIVMDETDVLVDDLQEWRRPDLFDKRPSPLVVEFYLDTAHLTHNQALAILDGDDKRWDVADSLASSAASSPHPTKNGGRYCEVVLERWTIELGDSGSYSAPELNDNLPNVYKKGVVLFRSLYSLLRLLPAWKLYRKLGRQSGSHQALRLKFRILKAQSLAHEQQDSLYTPLCPDERDSVDAVGYHDFKPLVTRVGPLSCSLAYRTNCAFVIADLESLRSERFLGLDDDISTLPAGRSLPGERTERPRARYSSTAVPATTTTTRARPRGLLGAYGSLGTFHAANKRGSPVSELKQRALDDEDDDDEMQRLDAIRAEEGASKRTSVNFLENPPFKAGSLASSPRPTPSPSTSAGRTESALAKYGGTSASNSKRISFNALPQQQLRAPSTSNDVAIASSGSSSPKPAPVRYSSSFANRPRRWTPQSNKAGESNASSGRASSDSKDKSEQLNEAMPESSGSAKTDEDDIASFISDLGKAKDIKFHTPPSARDNVVNLAKYSSMRDPSTQLAEEMSSSSLIQTSITPPSRRLSNVPGLSTSSSPNRTLTHAPHVRSRLSTHSIAEERSRTSAASGEGSDSPKIPEEEQEDDDDEDLPFIFQQDNF